LKLSIAVRIYSIIAFGLIILIGGMLQYAEIKHNESMAIFAQQVELKLKAKDLLQVLTDRETGQRGFLLTLDSQFIEPYIQAGEQLDGLVSAIKPAMDNASWKELDALIKARAEYFLATFNLVGGFAQQQKQQQQQQQQAIDRVRSGEGMRFMDNIRVILSNTTDTAALKADQAEQTYQSFSQWTNWLIYSSTLLLMAILLAPSFYIGRSVSRPLKQLGVALEQLKNQRKQTIIIDENASFEIRTISQQIKAATDELLRAEYELADKLDELEKTRSQQDKIFAIVGHELRTPAAAIKMLLDEEELLNKKSHNIAEAALHASQLLRVLMDMRLSTSGEAVLDISEESHQRIKVFNLIKSSVLALQPLAEKHQFIIDLNGLVVNSLGHYGNPKILQQILQNFIRNAILHSEGSLINISMGHEHLDNNLTHFTIEVRDNGKGIPSELRTRMFNAFERGNSVSDGTGLGLHVASEMANTLLQGKLFYRDNPEGGAIFHLSFVLEKVMEEEQVPIATDSPLHGLKILLAEDTPTLRLLGKNILERAGSLVQVASDGEEALRELENFDADLVLTDIMMPNMNGYELAEALRKHGYHKPIIGVTGATIGMEAKRLIESGANCVLAKPLTVKMLEAALKSLKEGDLR